MPLNKLTKPNQIKQKHKKADETNAGGRTYDMKGSGFFA